MALVSDKISDVSTFLTVGKYCGKHGLSHWYRTVCPTAQVTVHKLVCCHVMVMVVLATINGCTLSPLHMSVASYK